MNGLRELYWSILLTCISLSETLARWDPSADLAEFCGLMYKFWSTIVWENVGLLWILEQRSPCLKLKKVMLLATLLPNFLHF